MKDFHEHKDFAVIIHSEESVQDLFWEQSIFFSSNCYSQLYIAKNKTPHKTHLCLPSVYNFSFRTHAAINGKNENDMKNTSVAPVVGLYFDKMKNS